MWRGTKQTVNGSEEEDSFLTNKGVDVGFTWFPAGPNWAIKTISSHYVTKNKQLPNQL